MQDVSFLIIVFAGLFACYFVVKWAVKNGINQSMLFADKQKKQKKYLRRNKANKYSLPG